MISPATEKLILAGKVAQAAKEHSRTTNCSIGDAIKAVRKWKKDRADKIGRK